MDYFAIIERIEAQLKMIGMGKMDFYAAIGISPNSYRLWKIGETKPTNDNLEKVAAVLGLELEYLMFGHKEKPAPISESELDNWFYDLVSGLTPDEQLQVAGYIQRLKANRKD